jgi:hypothetical protein
MSIPRVDLRFALPIPVERAVVLGGLDPWLEGLREAGIEAAEFLSSATPQFVVAPAELAVEAISTGAEMIVLEGRGGEAPLRRAGLKVQRVIAMPSIADPRHLVRPDHPHAAVYAFQHWSIPTTLPKRLRNSLVRFLLARGHFPDLLPGFAVGLRSEAYPFFLARAEEFGVPRGAEWFMTLGTFDVFSRSVFQVFAPGASEPGWVVKFSRVPGYTLPFERDERGLRLAVSAGKEVGAHVPRILGRLESDGLHGSVEIAARGYLLTNFLQRKVSPEEKLRVIDSVAAWILELGTRTATNPTTLGSERDRLARDVVPHWADSGISARLVEQLPQLPSVLQHGYVGTWNVIARDASDFSVIDWESVREHAFPLWDLVFFLADALLHLDGATSMDVRDRHTARLFRGELPSSKTLFRWVRRAVRSLELPPDAVGPVTTLCWLDHAVADASRRAKGMALGAARPWGQIETERVARLWFREPGLGPDWDLWRKR